MISCAKTVLLFSYSITVIRRFERRSQLEIKFLFFPLSSYSRSSQLVWLPPRDDLFRSQTIKPAIQSVSQSAKNWIKIALLCFAMLCSLAGWPVTCVIFINIDQSEESRLELKIIISFIHGNSLFFSRSPGFSKLWFRLPANVCNCSARITASYLIDPYRFRIMFFFLSFVPYCFA